MRNIPLYSHGDILAARLRILRVDPMKLDHNKVRIISSEDLLPVGGKILPITLHVRNEKQ